MNKIIVVTGLTRCGSSLMMQMLHAGGCPISCDPGNEEISGEHVSQTETLKQIALGYANGKAVKSLDPLNFPLPPNKDYEFIWMQRDFDEQAKSIMKFLNVMLRVPINKKSVRAMRESVQKDTEPSIKYLKRLGTVNRIDFEDCILKPNEVARRVSGIVGDLNVVDMASVVIERNVKCYDGILELQLLRRQRMVNP